MARKIMVGILCCSIVGCKIGPEQSALYYQSDGQEGSCYVFDPKQVFVQYVTPSVVRSIRVSAVEPEENQNIEKEFSDPELIKLVCSALQGSEDRWNDCDFGAPTPDHQIQFCLTNEYKTSLWIGNGWVKIKRPGAQGDWFLYDANKSQRLRELLEIPPSGQPVFDPLKVYAKVLESHENKTRNNNVVRQTVGGAIGGVVDGVGGLVGGAVDLAIGTVIVVAVVGVGAVVIPVVLTKQVVSEAFGSKVEKNVEINEAESADESAEESSATQEYLDVEEVESTKGQDADQSAIVPATLGQSSGIPLK